MLVPTDNAWRRRRRRRRRFNVGRVLVLNCPPTSLFTVRNAAGWLLIMPGGSPCAGLKEGPWGGYWEPCCAVCRHSSTSFCTACQRADDPSSTWLSALRTTSDPRPPPSPPPPAPPPSPPSPSAWCACNRCCSFRLLRSRSRRAERQSAQHACLGLKNFSGRYRLHALHSERASGNMPRLSPTMPSCPLRECVMHQGCWADHLSFHVSAHQMV